MDDMEVDAAIVALQTSMRAALSAMADPAASAEEMDLAVWRTSAVRRVVTFLLTELLSMCVPRVCLSVDDIPLDEDALHDFHFWRADLARLIPLLGLPPIVNTPHCHPATAEEAALIVMYRLAYPGHWKITCWREAFRPVNTRFLAEVSAVKMGYPGALFLMYLDGTDIYIQRPGGTYDVQRSVFIGHHRQHAILYLAGILSNRMSTMTGLL
eukprot:m51a1_g12156 hypothetical protein (212) ;mRNA; f:3170-4082